VSKTVVTNGVSIVQLFNGGKGVSLSPDQDFGDKG